MVFLLFGPVGGSTMDDEEYRNVVVSLIIHARALLDGHYPFWTSDLGLGMPHPLHPTFFFHPLMPLFGVLSPGTAVRLFFIAHAVLGAAGCWALVRHVGAGRWTAALATSTWLLATPALNYSLTDLWLGAFFRMVALSVAAALHAPHPGPSRGRRSPGVPRCSSVWWRACWA